MDIKKYGMIGLVASLLVALLFVSGCASSADQAVALELAEGKGYAEGLLAAEPVVEVKEVEVVKEVKVEVVKDSEETLAELQELKDLVSDHEEEVGEWERSDEALELCREFLADDEDGDVSDALVDALDELGWSVEDKDEELLSWKLQSDAEVESEEDEDELNAELSGEVKVKFRDSGSDGDRHTEYVDFWCEVEDGEVDSWELGVAE